MSMMVTKVDDNQILLWCGHENFNPVAAQKKLQKSGLEMKAMRKDKWCVVGSSLDKQEKTNG